MIKTYKDISSLTGDGCMNMWGGTCLEQNNVVAITSHICSGKAQAWLVKMARSDPHIIAICRQSLAIARLACHSGFLFRGEYKEQKEKAVSARDNVQAKKDTQTT